MLIDCILGGTTSYTDLGIPYAVGGELGEMDDSLLTKQTGGHDNENETVEYIEYWFEGNLVHRSVDIKLKKMPEFQGEAGQIG